MAKRLATLEEFLTVVRECRTFGDKSSAMLTFVSNPSAGDEFIVKTNDLLPDSQYILTASAGPVTPGDELFLIGPDPTATASNFADAVATNPISSLISTGLIGNIVEIVSVLTGPVSEHSLAVSNPAAMVLSAPNLEGGSDQVDYALEAAGCSINIECFGECASQAHIYLAAHFCVMMDPKKGGTDIRKKKKIDKIEVENGNFTSGVFAEDLYASTRWGQLYLGLERRARPLPVVGRGRLTRSPWC